MRKSSWTPSIVPRDDDQGVYLVLDDLGRRGRVWREADTETADRIPSSRTCSPANTNARAASSPSTPLRDGRRTYRRTSSRNCVGVAICRPAMYRFSCRISSIDTKAGTAISSCRCRCAWCEHGVPAKKTGCDRRQGAVRRIRRARARDVDRESAVWRALDPRNQVRRLSGPASHRQRKRQGFHSSW
jgi:hypothetical protein